MTSESNRIGILGVNHVQNVLTRWGWGYQPISQENDDGLDGVIYIRSKKTDKNNKENRSKHTWEFTGGLIHVQIKSGKGYISSRNENEIKLNINHLDKKRKIWSKSPIPCIVIFVFWDENEVEHSYWADLKSDLTYVNNSNTLIKVPLKNRFMKSPECKGPLRRLARTSTGYSDKPLINLSKFDSLSGRLPASLNSNLSYTLKNKSIEFYKEWKLIGAKNPYFGPVLINRTGWSHITRQRRPIARIEASFNLLPLAARIVNEVTTWRMLTPVRKYENRRDGYICFVDFVGLTAKVIMNNRNSSEVMVVLKREVRVRNDETNTPEKTRLWFYTVYEPGRGK